MSAGFERAAVRLTAAEVYPSTAILDATVSPDGTQIGLIYRYFNEVDLEGDRPRTRTLTDLLLIPVDGSPTRSMFGISDGVVSVFWRPEETRPPALAVYREEAGTLAVHVLGEPAGRTIFRQKLHQPRLDRGESDLSGPRWSPDSERLLIAIRDDRSVHLVELTADGRRSRHLLTTTGVPVSWDWSPDGTRIATMVSRSEGTTADLLLIDTESGEVRTLAEERHLQYRLPVARWSPSGNLVVRSNRSGWSKLWEVDPDDGAARPISTGEWDEGAFRIAANGRIVAASNRDQTGRGDDLWLFDESGTSTPMRLTDHPGVNAPIGWVGDDRVVYWHADGRGESDMWIQTCSDATRTRRTATLPVVSMAKVPAPVEIVIQGEAGLLTGMLHRPAGASSGERFPGVIWAHGGPASAVRPVWSAMAGFCTLLANEGFIVLNVNYRGSTAHGVDHMNAISGDGVGKHDLADLIAGADYLRSHAEVDAARGIGIAGRSWGGYLTLMGLTTAPDVFSCGFAGAAIGDWAVQQAEGDVRYYDYWLLGGWAYDRPDLVAERSPITHVDALRAPLLVTHGEADTNVPPGQMRTFVERARCSGKTVDAHFYPHEGHILQIRRNQQDELDRMVRFFRRWLSPWNFVDNPSGNQVTY